jgi:nitrite reductase/ring-hydroxylating ferredoxin subunit
MGCEGYDDGMPRVPVNFYIYLYDASYFDLLNYGGYVYVTGGISGIVVYRLSEWEFVAFDRACPYDWDHEDSWIWVEPDRLTLKCQKCGSLFNILDGGIIIGPSQFPLRRYATNFDGVRLRVRS